MQGPPKRTKIQMPQLQSEYQKNRNFNKTFQKFYLIKDAVALSHKNGHLPIFSLDKPNAKLKGAKAFYTSSYNKFWNYYSFLSPTDRCFYETILQGELCHLYADIEGIRATNKNTNLEQLYEMLLKELCSFYRKTFNLPNDIAIKFLDPDSSTSRKFSKHCIFKVRNCYFKNNYHCGAFMRQFQKHIIDKYGLPSEKDNPFFIWSEKETDYTDSSKKVFFVDMGVYTLRRQFRLLGSSKRSVPRRPLYLNGKKGVTKEDFFNCLIQYVPDPNAIKRVFTLKEPDGSDPLSCSLRTFDDDGNPISISGNVSQMPSQPIARTKCEINSTALPWDLQNVLKHYIKSKYGYDIVSYKFSEGKIKLGTNDLRCMNKLKNTGVLEHKTNHVYFVIFAKTGYHLQGCYDESVCKKGSKKLFTSLGHIKDETVMAALHNWMYPKKIEDCVFFEIK